MRFKEPANVCEMCDDPYAACYEQDLIEYRQVAADSIRSVKDCILSLERPEADMVTEPLSGLHKNYHGLRSATPGLFYPHYTVWMSLDDACAHPNVVRHSQVNILARPTSASLLHSDLQLHC